MKFPLILWPEIVKKVVETDFSYEASELIFDRFYAIQRSKNSKKIINEPKKPYIDFGFFSHFENIDLLGIICLILIWWIVLPYMLINLAYEIFVYINRKAKYKRAVKKYNFLLRQWPSEYIGFDEFYSTVLERFKTHSLNIDSELTIVAKEIRIEELKKIGNKITEIPRVEEYLKRQKGISENFFINRLKTYFDFLDIEIVSDCRVDCFFPDIVIKTKTGLYIDIEVDEPYAGDTKEVIHYYNPEKEFYCDEMRNSFFLESGWIVIRFSEKQIVKNSFSCCYEIALILGQILEFDIPKNKIQERLIPEDFWSKETGEQLAMADYRNTYIPPSLTLRFNRI